MGRSVEKFSVYNNIAKLYSEFTDFVSSHTHARHPRMLINRGIASIRINLSEII